MDIAVIAAERFGQRPHTGDMVAAHVAQQFHTLAGDDAREGILAFKGQMALVEGLVALGSMPGINEPLRRIVLHLVLYLSGDSEIHIAHFVPRNLRTSAQKSAISCPTVLNT